MLTYICDHGDQYLTNILIDLDGQQLTVRMKRAVNNGQVVVSLLSEILDPVSEVITLSENESFDPEVVRVVLDVIVDHLNQEYKNIMKEVWN